MYMDAQSVSRLRGRPSKAGGTGAPPVWGANGREADDLYWRTDLRSYMTDVLLPCAGPLRRVVERIVDKWSGRRRVAASQAGTGTRGGRGAEPQQADVHELKAIERFVDIVEAIIDQYV